MDLLVLNKKLEVVAVVDTYKSSIWTDRYRQAGDFELYMPMTSDVLTYIRQDYYLLNKQSEHMMIIENILIKSDLEDGNNIRITGRSLESILSRRIIWGQLMIRGSLQNGIKTLLDICIINPSDPERKIDNFIFKESTDPAITNLMINAQYTGDNLLNVIENICAEHDIGFKITLNEDNQFVFELYAGIDRSYDQTEQPYVVFSPKFENIINSNYIESKEALKNITLVGGEGEGSLRKYAVVGSGSGLERRELFTNASDISSNTGDGVTLSEEEYDELLQQRGIEKLAECINITSFEGQIETTIMYRYGEDFFNGDIIQIANEYGHETKARIIEMVMTENEEGIHIYPTFTTIS